jgi:hypothetical protein
MLPAHVDAARAYARTLARAGRRAVPALAKGLGVGRRAAAEAFGAAGALVLAGLARHQRRRPGSPGAAQAVLEKYGRPADVDAPDLAVAGHLARPDLDPRLGGLLGEAGDLAARWLADRTGGSAAALARGLAASAPLALGALRTAVPPDALAALLHAASTDALEAPARLLDRGPVGDAFRAARGAGVSVLDRLLRR